MNDLPLSLVALLFLGLVSSGPVHAQRDGSRAPDGKEREAAPGTVEVPVEAGIAWFGTWNAGLAEAKRTGRPILLMSGAPQCHGVPGMW